MDCSRYGFTSGARDRAETYSFWNACRPVSYSGASTFGFVSAAGAGVSFLPSQALNSMVLSNATDSTKIFRMISFQDPKMSP
jgi:hypothetical protein